MIKYRAKRYFRQEIVVVEVEKETANSVWVNGRIFRKDTSRERFFDTWEQAKAWLLEWAEGGVASAQRSLETANGKLGNVKGMKP